LPGFSVSPLAASEEAQPAVAMSAKAQANQALRKTR